MKKLTQDNTLFNTDKSTNQNIIEENKVKTTDVNILLNRVRLDRKRTLKKKIIFSLILVSIVSALITYFII